MERRNRNILVALIAVIITVAILSSFGLGIFAPDTAKIVLPGPEASASPDVGNQGDGGLVRVEVTPDTVQSVIATLKRPESYSRTVTIEDFWGDGESGVTQASVWVDAGWTRTDAVLPSGLTRCSIVGDDMFWLWYRGNSEVLSGPADGTSADLEGQRIPSYEDVLALEKSEIVQADYRAMDGLNCIYVETGTDLSGYTESYWIDDDSGLLVRAETMKNGEVVYRMTAGTLERPVASGASFALPDGTVLHQVHA